MLYLSVFCQTSSSVTASDVWIYKVRACVKALLLLKECLCPPRNPLLAWDSAVPPEDGSRDWSGAEIICCVHTSAENTRRGFHGGWCSPKNPVEPAEHPGGNLELSAQSGNRAGENTGTWGEQSSSSAGWGHSWACSAGGSMSNSCSTIWQWCASNAMDSRRKEVNCSSLPPFPWDDFYQKLFFLQGQAVSFFLKHHKQFINRR